MKRKQPAVYYRGGGIRLTPKFMLGGYILTWPMAWWIYKALHFHQIPENH